MKTFQNLNHKNSEVDNFKNTLRRQPPLPHIEYKSRKVNGVKVHLPFERNLNNYKNIGVGTSDLNGELGYPNQDYAVDIPTFSSDQDRLNAKRPETSKIHK